MKLTADQARVFRIWLSSRGGVLLDCPICRQRDWGTPEIIALHRAPASADPKNAAPGIYEEITVTCGVCGYTHHFSAAALHKAQK